MTIQAVLLPLFVEVVLTFVLLCWMAYPRTEAFRRGASDGRHRLAPAELAAATPLSSPTPFTTSSSCPCCSTCSRSLLDHRATPTSSSWYWPGSSCSRGWSTPTSSHHNDVRQRGTAFIVGAFVLMLMWLIFIVRILARHLMTPRRRAACRRDRGPRRHRGAAPAGGRSAQGLGPGASLRRLGRPCRHRRPGL